jgi:hypothetical protein
MRVNVLRVGAGLLALLLAGQPAAAATDWGKAMVDSTMKRKPTPADLGV